MPLAILLQEQLGILTKGVKKIQGWDSATETFALVVDRLRSAYLVRWFGTSLPSVGLSLRAAFAGGIALLFGLSATAIAGNREPFDFLGAAAELIDALRRFWEQVTGPREAVRNPLLREILLLGDRTAALLAFLLGGFAILVA